jgi:hypothetical protein
VSFPLKRKTVSRTCRIGKKRVFVFRLTNIPLLQKKGLAIHENIIQLFLFRKQQLYFTPRAGDRFETNVS